MLDDSADRSGTAHSAYGSFDSVVVAHAEAPEPATRRGVAHLDLSRSVVIDGVPLVLSVRETELLHLLVTAAGEVVDRDTILAALWPADAVPAHRAVDMLIRRVRQKLGRASAIIQSERGRGYRYVAQTDVDITRRPREPGADRTAPRSLTADR